MQPGTGDSPQQPTATASPSGLQHHAGGRLQLLVTATHVPGSLEAPNGSKSPTELVENAAPTLLPSELHWKLSA